MKRQRHCTGYRPRIGMPTDAAGKLILEYTYSDDPPPAPADEHVDHVPRVNRSAAALAKPVQPGLL